MLNNELIIAKMRNMQEYLSEVEPILSLPKETILDSLEKIRTLERNFQLIVDAMLAINIHIIRELELNAPDDLQSTFTILADGRVLPRDFAQKVAPVVGLRNLLVHGYEKIDRVRFVEAFLRNLKDFDAYLKLIYDLTQEQDAKS